MVEASTVMVMLVEGWQKEVATSNTCLQTPLWHIEAGIVATWLQILPVVESR